MSRARWKTQPANLPLTRAQVGALLGLTVQGVGYRVRRKGMALDTDTVRALLLERGARNGAAEAVERYLAGREKVHEIRRKAAVRRGGFRNGG